LLATPLKRSYIIAVVLTLSGIRKRYGGQVVLDGINWFAPNGSRIGLVGANGSGKSTLLRMIAGQIEPDDGQVITPKECTVGYLAQEVFGISGRTVLAQAMTAFADIHALADECSEVEHQLAKPP
jgi:ATP-binding cassette subfamily F protein 3